ncbi:NADP oxidoreductase coenzyme F420-dependent [Tenacibaculum sp. MAR_2009_124]|uniref:Rossmann-like and DUF2520 domain-containing protein n=1 Tax=Tenacibaculum sp. MAR_2009_124 TaxID=1250059 RepID=UPI0008985AEE|nr:DUF2520 domain-containing protein [Tenacibaculum sp. MAR_2009_124]SEB52687.1 NADP oxidoreductase coenzyme F420-dependent [Tenacibaculum sp. MAR_2009_124]
MIRIVIIGGGKVANHLIKAFLNTSDVQLIQIYARNIEQVKQYEDQTDLTDNLQKLKKADVYIISVSDDAIEEVSSNVTEKGLVVHTSGTVSMNSLKNAGKKGIFYLLQSFSKDKEVNFDEIPFCLEAENDEDLELLEQLALTIGKKVYHITSEQRSYLHVAAVFVNNFTNHLYSIGNDLCDKYNVPFDVLYPLIKETALKIETLSPKEAQTGPAIRNDNTTIKKHLDVLNKHQQELYKTLTDSIINGKKL